MSAISDFLEHFPIVTLGVVAIVIVAAVKSIGGELEFTAFVDVVKNVTIGAGVFGGARAVLAHAPSRVDYSSARRITRERRRQ
jgi:hypothetical protein